MEYLDTDQLNSCLDREVGDLSWRRIAGALANEDRSTNEISDLAETTQEYLNNYQQDYDDMCFAYEDTIKIFSVGRYSETIEAFSMKKLWELRECKPDEMKYAIRPSAITTDGCGHLFVIDTVNNCIQVFDTDGTYMCIVDCYGKLELGTPMRIAWSKTESALVLVHRVTREPQRGIDRCFISVLKVQIRTN